MISARGMERRSLRAALRRCGRMGRRGQVQLPTLYAWVEGRAARRTIPVTRIRDPEEDPAFLGV
jgi:hypothetical protein